MQYKIIKRYQYRTRNGLQWTDWHEPYSVRIFNGPDEAKQWIENQKAMARSIEKATRTKTEYQLVVDE